LTETKTTAILLDQPCCVICGKIENTNGFCTDCTQVINEKIDFEEAKK
jgi:hypothetical protein